MRLLNLFGLGTKLWTWTREQGALLRQHDHPFEFRGVATTCLLADCHPPHPLGSTARSPENPTIYCCAKHGPRVPVSLKTRPIGLAVD